tara:strand:- start:874 stop:1290 length:417 start_codon:yes stop_codon:yes gene_type:complete
MSDSKLEKILENQSNQTPIRINEMIVTRIEERLDIGKKKYGDTLSLTDERNFLKEAVEEALDLNVYLTAFLIQIESALKNRPKNEINVDELVLIMDGLGKLILTEKDNRNKTKVQKAQLLMDRLTEYADAHFKSRQKL